MPWRLSAPVRVLICRGTVELPVAERNVLNRPSGWQPASIQTAAAVCLVLFLCAIVVALILTVELTPPSTKLLASSVVVPVVGLTVVVLYLERKGKRWSYLGAVGLGVFGIALRLIISSQPQLEVGGGLPLGVTIVYLLLGLSVIVSSGLAFVRFPHAPAGGLQSD